MAHDCLYCDVCGKMIAYGKMKITHPKLNEHMHPQKIDFEVWCSACHENFYKMFDAWKELRRR